MRVTSPNEPRLHRGMPRECRDTPALSTHKYANARTKPVICGQVRIRLRLAALGSLRSFVAKCRLDSGLHAAVAMSGRGGCDARVLQVQQISQIVAPLLHPKSLIINVCSTVAGGGGVQNPSHFSRALRSFAPAGRSNLVPKKAFNETLFHLRRQPASYCLRQPDGELHFHHDWRGESGEDASGCGGGNGRVARADGVARRRAAGRHGHLAAGGGLRSLENQRRAATSI